MNWTIDWNELPKRDAKALDSEMGRRVKKKLDDAAKSGNPRENGKALTGDHAGQWVYRVGDYRAIVEFNDAEKVIVVTKVGPRDTVYRRTRIYRVSEDPADWQPTDDRDGGDGSD